MAPLPLPQFAAMCCPPCPPPGYCAAPPAIPWLTPLQWATAAVLLATLVVQGGTFRLAVRAYRRETAKAAKEEEALRQAREDLRKEREALRKWEEALVRGRKALASKMTP